MSGSRGAAQPKSRIPWQRRQQYLWSVHPHQHQLGGLPRWFSWLCNQPWLDAYTKRGRTIKLKERMRKKQTNQPNKHTDHTNHLSLEFSWLLVSWTVSIWRALTSEQRWVMIISLHIRSVSDSPVRESKNGQKSTEIKLEVVGGGWADREKPPKRKANLKHPINH